jgi:hypothetical protein
MMPPKLPLVRDRTKTAIVTLRVDPRVKAAAQLAAKHDHRSLTSLIEVLILNHCKSLNIVPGRLRGRGDK